MRLSFFGTRGSTSTCSREYLEFGGNTPCVVAESDSGYVVLDAGHGIIPLGETILLTEKYKNQKEIHIFLSHMHWDHIQGIPFFCPIWNPDFTIYFYGYFDYSESLKNIISKQFSLNYSPIGDIKNLKARLEFIELKSGDTVNLFDMVITAAPMFHTAPRLSYHMKSGETTILYAGDCELANDSDGVMKQLLTGCTAAILDTNYSDDDYEQYRGWGHSSIGQAINVALAAGVKNLFTFHYSPDYDDITLASIIAEAREKYPEINIIPSKESLAYEL